MDFPSAPPPSSSPPAPPERVVEPDGAALFRFALFRQTPRVWVTPLLVGVNVSVFLAMVATGVSVMSPSIESLLRWGADYAPRTTAGEWWRLMANTFIHVGAIHLAMNMIGLWQIGGLVERLLGHRAFLLIYLVSGLCGSLASITWHPFVVSAGASGAVFGVYGVLVAYLVRHRGSIPRPVLMQLQKSTIFFLGLNVVFGLQQKGIDMAAHLGGLLGGFIAALVVSRPLMAERSLTKIWREGLVAALALALVGAAVLFLPRAADLQSALQDFQAVEQRTVDAYNGALQRRQEGKLTDASLARIIDEQVLPPWQAHLQHLRTLRGLPASQSARLDLITTYMSLRGQGWAAFSEALRTGDDSRSKQAQLLHQRADTLMNGELTKSAPP